VDDNNHEEKTENPTSYRLKKAKKEGNNRFSRELNSLLILIISLMIFWFNKQDIVVLFEKIMRSGLVFNSSVIHNKNIFNVNTIFSVNYDIWNILKIIFFPMFLTIFLSIVCSNYNFYIKSLHFDFKKLNPLQGLKKIFSNQIFVEFFKTIFKIFLVSCISYFYMLQSFSTSLKLIGSSISFVLKKNFFAIFSCVLTILITIIPIVLFDIFWERFNYYKKLRMTRKEVRDEFKTTEGDPNVKSRIRRTMREVMRRRMISNVSESDVIIVNPSHYAVALQYKENSMSAPKILAKGSGKLALKIRKIGNEHSIPVLFSSSLARTLYLYTDIGQYVPSTLYAAVAEVLAWVWKIRIWKKEGGIFPEQPHNFFIPLELRTLKEDKDL